MASDGYQGLPALTVAALRHPGPHDPRHTDDTWSDLILYASPRRLLGRRDDVRGVGLLWDDPRVHPPAARRYDVGVPIDRSDVLDIEPPAFVLVTVPGRYLHERHTGPYDTLAATYDRAFTRMGFERVQLTAAPVIELYRNSPSEVGEDELVTDLYFPIAGA